MSLLKQLKTPYIQEWYCDIDKFARQTAEANYPAPKTVYPDMLTRKKQTATTNFYNYKHIKICNNFYI
jgi:hypothetical protein